MLNIIDRAKISNLAIADQLQSTIEFMSTLS